MTRMNLDQLNSPVEQVVEPNNVLDIDTYFDEMYLTESEKEERKDLAKAIFVILSAILTIIQTNELLKNSHDIEYYKEYVSDSLESLFKGTFRSDKYHSQIETFADEFIDSTMRHINESYFTSEDRAIVNAEQQSNATYNQEQYQQAVQSGKTKKRWVTMHDQRVRKTHDAADDQEVDIDKPFEVGDSELMFPCDLSLGANLREICNCRCVVVYTGDSNELTDDEQIAITRYIGGEAYTINDKLRKNEPLNQEETRLVNLLDSALSKSKAFNGNLYREIYIPNENLDTFLADYKIGEKITFNAYTSTSKKKDLYGKDANVKFAFLGTHKGKDISYINETELEVLYEREQSFYVIGNDYINGVNHIVLVEV